MDNTTDDRLETHPRQIDLDSYTLAPRPRSANAATVPTDPAAPSVSARRCHLSPCQTKIRAGSKSSDRPAATDSSTSTETPPDQALHGTRPRYGALDGNRPPGVLTIRL